MCISIFYLSNLSKQLRGVFSTEFLFLNAKIFFVQIQFFGWSNFYGGMFISLKFFGYSLFVWKNNKHKCKGYQEEWKQLIM